MIKKVYLYSPGGCGTRMLYKWIQSAGISINSQANVHRMIYPDKLNDDEVMIYLSGSQIDSVLSFYNKYYTGDVNFLRLHCQSLGVSTVPEDIHQYIKNGYDQFGIRDHKRRFDNSNFRWAHNCYCFHYDELWSGEYHLRELLGIEESLPKRKTRSTKSWVTDDIIKGLGGIYYDYGNN